MRRFLSLRAVLYVVLLSWVPNEGDAAEPCAIRLEFNDFKVAPFIFRKNDRIHIRAEGSVAWYRRGSRTIASGPEGTDLDRSALQKNAGLFGYMSPPMPSARDGALIGSIRNRSLYIGKGGILHFPEGGPLRLKVNDAWGQDNTGAYTVILGNTPFAPDYDLARAVEKIKGQLSYGFRDRFGEYMWSERTHPLQGHQYLSVTSLGRQSLTSSQIATFLKKNVRRVFPGTAQGKNGDEVKMGNEFSLLIGKYGPRVRTIAVTSTSFTFVTLPGEHPLRGTAVHGVFKDSRGEAWLFQQGRGVTNEPLWIQRLNLVVAPEMWQLMASKVRTALAGSRS